MRKVLALYDRDTSYATRFMEFFKKNEPEYEICIFTKAESLQEYLRQHLIDILLLGTDMGIEDIPPDNVKLIVQFTEDQSKEKDFEKLYIFKYQSVQSVISKAISYFRRWENELHRQQPSGKTKIISIHSPVPEESKTAFAWSVSMLQSEHSSVLFIPMELLPTDICSCNESDNNSALSEFIYYLKENPDTITKMRSLVQYHGNLSVLSGITCGFELLSLTKEDVRKWIQNLITSSEYDLVVFYISFYSEAVMELLKQSNEVLVPWNNSKYEKALLTEWNRQMEVTGAAIAQDRIIKIPLKSQADGRYLGISLHELQQSRVWSVAEDYLQ